MTDDVIQQSLLDETERIEKYERLAKGHPKAFRDAFDFLVAHYPPANTEEYWLKTCKDVSYISAENIENELCQELLYVIVNYLSELCKKWT